MSTFISFILFFGLMFLSADQITGPTYTGAVASSGPPPSGCTTFTDNFSGSGALSINWTIASASGYNSVNRNGGVAQPNPTNTKGIAVYTAASSGGDQCSQFTMGSTASLSDSTGAGVYTDLLGNGYFYIPAFNAVYLVVTGGGTTTPVTGCPGASGGDQIKLTVVASSHLLTCTNITLGTSSTGTDSTYTTGFPSFIASQVTSISATVGNWSGQ